MQSLSADLRELYWAAGFIEGEGYFGCSKDMRGRNFASPKITVSQKSLEPLNRLSALFGKAGMYRCKRSGVTNWTLYGNRAIGVMMTLWPLMSERRREQIEKAIALWKRNSTHSDWAKSAPRCGSGRFTR